MKESDLGRFVVAWHESDGWDVFQEVEFLGFRADVVATKNGLVRVIEIKTSLTFDVMAQAKRWLPYVNSVMVAVPAPKKDSNGRSFAREVLTWVGAGLMEISIFNSGRWSVSFPVISKNFDSSGSKRLISILRPEHRTHAVAGSPSGGHWTPFKDTCAQFLDVLSKSDMLISDAVKLVKHHYKNNGSAIRSMSKWGLRGKIPGVSMKMKNGKVYARLK